MNKLFIGALVIVLIVFFLILNMNSNIQISSQQIESGSFSNSISGLKEARNSTKVLLKNGDKYTLTATQIKKNINGNVLKMLAYNESIPGPLITVAQGATVYITLKNETDVPTSLHSHGIRMENKFDGVVGMTQKAVPVGGTFMYKLTFPDAGVYWYHPHFREDYAQAAGLYGMFLVNPTDTQLYPTVNSENSLMIGDILVEDGALAPYSRVEADHTLMGRFGNTILTNGMTNWSATVKNGEVRRFYITNVSSTRIFNLTIPGAQIKVIGSDGGKLRTEHFADFVMLAPSERTTIDVLFAKPGVFSVLSVPAGGGTNYTLGTITVSEQLIEKDLSTNFGKLLINNDLSVQQEQLSKFLNKTPDKTLSISLSMRGMRNMGNMNGMMHVNTNKIEWEDTMAMMNGISDANSVKWKLTDLDGNKSNMDVKWTFKKGEMVKIRIDNPSTTAHPMQHPIHIHGQRFIVLATNNVANEIPVWKDTTLIQTGDTVDLLVDMSNPGTWLIHCHIPEHMESGMMTQFTILK